MPSPHENTRLISRRAFVLGGVQLSLATVMASRLYYLQFAQGASYQMLAEDNRVSLQLLAPERGLLLDCNGVPLARNKINYRVLLEKDAPAETRATLARAAELLAIDETGLARLTKELSRTNRGHAILVKEYLSWDELARLEFNAPRLPGLSIDQGYMRDYPFAEHASHLIGFVGGVTEKDFDREGDKGVLHLPGFKIGKDGLERVLEDRLRGDEGLLHMEVNAHGLPVKEVDRKPSVHGENMRLTIDSRLQEFASRRLGEESGAAILMRVETGDLLALAVMPAYDSNRFSRGIAADYWKSLLDNKKNPLSNKAIAGQYPPGSTFKTIVGLAALEANVISTGSRVFCPGHFQLGNHRFSCWKPEGHGSVNVVEALMHSCDVFFYTMAQRLGIGKIAAMGRRFGLGEASGIGFFNEKPGVMPDEAWKRARYEQPWHPGDTINCGIGQGYVLSTPLQLATMVARLANGGKAVNPRLWAPETEPEVPAIKIDPALIAVIQQGMDAVCNAQGGTAYSHCLREGEFRMGGKTGTSQVRRIIIHGQDQSKIPWEQRHHALFIGYAPVEKPVFATAVLIEHGGGGASAAAPVARDILAKALEFYVPGAEADHASEEVVPAPSESTVQGGASDGDELPASEDATPETETPR